MGHTVSIPRAVDRWPWTQGRETATVGGRTRKQNIENKWNKQKGECRQEKKQRRDTPDDKNERRKERERERERERDGKRSGSKIMKAKSGVLLLSFLLVQFPFFVFYLIVLAVFSVVTGLQADRSWVRFTTGARFICSCKTYIQALGAHVTYKMGPTGFSQNVKRTGH